MYAKSFREYGKLVERAAEQNDIECTDKAAAPRPEIREVLSLDTAGFSLDQTAMQTLTRIFPCMTSVLKTDADRVELVNQTIVEEVLQDLGTLDFGAGMAAKFNVAIWRERGMHRPLVREFAFQMKFKQREELRQKALERAKRFFVGLQQIGREWLSLGTTKTGTVYQLKGNPPQAHE